MAFDEDSPPETYKQFRKEILRTVEETQIEVEDDEFPTALFLVDRNFQGKVIYASDLAEEYDPDTPAEVIVQYVFPSLIQENNAKYFAFVFQGEKQEHNEEGYEIVAVLSGSLDHIEMVFAEIVREDYEEFCELEPWEREDVMNYSNLVIPFRRSICPQG